MIHLKTCIIYLSSYFMKNFLQYHITNRQKGWIEFEKGKGKNKTECQNKKICNAFRCILKSNIDKNFTKHDYVKFGDRSHDITVCLIWTTRSPHYYALQQLHCSGSYCTDCDQESIGRIYRKALGRSRNPFLHAKSDSTGDVVPSLWSL